AGISKVDLKTRTCKNITASDGLTSNTIYLLVADHSGNLYIGSNQGIDKFNTAVYNKTGTIEIKHYGKLEGFTGVECNTNSYFRGKDGSIWFGTINGAIRLDPTRQKNNNAEPFTYITDINLFFDPLERTEFVKETDSLTGLPTNLKLPYDKNHLTFNCIALSLTIPEKTLYSYKMAGFDKAWSPLSKQSYATYSFLPPGNYTFMVRAMNSDGVWTEAPATFNFTIVPPYWQTWWFYILASIALVLVFILFLRVRFNSLKNRAKDLQRKITHKTAELKKEKEIVDSQTKIIERKNKNITASINYAQRIQNTVLPTKENILKLFPDAFILLRPKDIVSGDFSWFSQVGDKIIVAAADCTGHGIPGAFMSLIGNNLLNDVVNNEKITEPAQILHRLHEKLIVTLKKTEKDSATVDGMDISLFVIDKKNQTLNFTSTGQPLIFIRDGKMEAINGGKYPLGLILKKERLYEPRTISIQKDDVFYLFTDGYVDQFGEMDDDKFSEVRLRNLLLEIHHQTMKDQENNLNRMLDLWKGQIPQLDDVMVIGIRI
ncbi:MAG TPA: SpoIIE family protein phosphatase, partial [Bacteroidia bacterium]